MTASARPIVFFVPLVVFLTTVAVRARAITNFEDLFASLFESNMKPRPANAALDAPIAPPQVARTFLTRLVNGIRLSGFGVAQLNARRGHRRIGQSSDFLERDVTGGLR